MFAFIGLRKSVSRLKREARPTRILAGGLLALALYTGMWAVLWTDAVRRNTFRCVGRGRGREGCLGLAWYGIMYARTHVCR